MEKRAVAELAFCFVQEGSTGFGISLPSAKLNN
jgi:hypothetical protein